METIKNDIDLTKPLDGYSSNLNEYMDVLRTDTGFCKIETVFNVACKFYNTLDVDDCFDYIYKQELTTYNSLSHKIKMYEPNYTLKDNLKLIDFINIVKWDVYISILSMLDEFANDSTSQDLIDALIDSNVIQ